MNEQLEHKIDKSAWPVGPWTTEPDKLQWVDKETDLDCLIVRSRLGNLCGYIGVQEGHPYFDRTYDESWVDVHGGLTFSGFCEGIICHVPEEGRPDRIYWLGFDCAHWGDLMPFSLTYMPGHPSTVTYKDISYVKAECANLAKQLAEVK